MEEDHDEYPHFDSTLTFLGRVLEAQDYHNQNCAIIARIEHHLATILEQSRHFPPCRHAYHTEVRGRLQHALHAIEQQIIGVISGLPLIPDHGHEFQPPSPRTPSPPPSTSPPSFPPRRQSHRRLVFPET